MNAKIHAAAVFMWLILAVCVGGWAESEVGEVRAVEGSVSIDILGTDSFIPAMVEDPIFENTVIKTGFESSAVLFINGEEFSIPAEATIRVDALIATGKKKRGARWFSSILNAIRNVLGKKDDGEKTTVLGGRASEAVETRPTWVLDEDDDDSLFEKARELINEESYSEAIDRLDQILFQPMNALAGEVAYLRGHALYMTGLFDMASLDFRDAIEELALEKIPESSVSFGVPLRFEYASAQYLLGNVEDATAILDPISKFRNHDLEPYILAIFASALSESGKSAEAKRIAKDAVERYGDSNLADQYRTILAAE